MNELITDIPLFQKVDIEGLRLKGVNNSLYLIEPPAFKRFIYLSSNFSNPFS